MVRYLLELLYPRPPSAKGRLHTECGSQGRKLRVAGDGCLGDCGYLATDGQAGICGMSRRGVWVGGMGLVTHITTLSGRCTARPKRMR